MMETKRAKLFSQREIDVMTTFMDTNISKINASHSVGGPNNHRRVAGLWEQLTDEVNAVGNGPRSVKQVKEKWRNMKKIAKTSYTVERVGMGKTGGGPAPPEMSQTSLTIIDLLKDSASYSGICDDSETIINTASNSSFDLSHDLFDDVLTNPECGHTEAGSISQYVQAPESTSSTSTAAYIADAPSAASYVGSGSRKEEVNHQQQTAANKTKRKRSLADAQLEYFETAIVVQRKQLILLEKATTVAELLVKKFS